MTAPRIPAPLGGLAIFSTASVSGWYGGFRRAFTADLVRPRVRGSVAAGQFASGQRYTLDLLNSTWRLSAPRFPFQTIEGRGILRFARAIYGQDEGALAVYLLETLDGVEFDEVGRKAIASAVSRMMARQRSRGERAPS